jgi:hypothetical protein
MLKNLDSRFFSDLHTKFFDSDSLDCSALYIINPDFEIYATKFIYSKLEKILSVDSRPLRQGKTTFS